MNGRFGAYVQLGETPEQGKGREGEKPKRASLQAGMTESTVTLDEALKLLSLPREVGMHPADNEPIVANFGRFGPYVKHGDEFRSLESEDDVFTMTLDAALALLRAPKQGRRRQAARTVLKALGAHPASGAQVQLLAGRYGPYVTDGTTNASMPKGADPAKLTCEEAVELLKARRRRRAAEAAAARRPHRRPRRRAQDDRAEESRRDLVRAAGWARAWPVQAPPTSP